MNTITHAPIQVEKTKASRINEVDWNHLPFGKIFSDHSFIAEYKDGKWASPRIVPYGPITVSPAISGLHYCQSIFEGLKATRTSNNDVLVFRPRDNARRLNHSAERICLAPVPEELFMDGLEQLLNIDRAWVPTDEDCSLYIRPFLFSTDPSIGLRPSEEFMFMIITGPVGKYYSEALKVKIETHYTRAAQGGTGYAKTGVNYSGSIYPALLAQQKGYHQLLWTDAIEHRYVEESGTMNVMFVIHDTLVTPALNDTILAGINRDSALTLAADWGMKVSEQKIDIYELIEQIKKGNVSEAFGVGTAATVAPISTLGFEDIDYTLPPVEKWKVAPKIKDTLDAIKRGASPDIHNWIVKI